MASYRYRNKNNDAERKLEKILRTSDRMALEQQFALDHKDDSNADLRNYIKEAKLKNKNFKREHLIGYCYIVERFGSWQKVITLVNRDIAMDKKLKDNIKKDREESILSQEP